MSVYDVVVLSVLAVLVVLAGYFVFRKRKSGKCVGCDGYCSDCLKNGGCTSSVGGEKKEHTKKKNKIK